MANADKCYLNIPFKDTARANLAFDDEGMLRKEGLERFNSELFENFKDIERRINDPDCGGEGCSPTGWRGGTGAFGITGSSLVGLSGTTGIATGGTDWVTFASEGTAFDLDVSGAGRISPSVAGWYSVHASTNGVEDSGNDDVAIGVYIQASNNSVGSASLVWVVDGITGTNASTSMICPMTVSDDWEIGILFRAPVASTRIFNFGAFGSYGLQVGIARLCGFDDGSIDIP